MSALGGRETIVRLRQGYQITVQAGEDSADVMLVPRCDSCRWWDEGYCQRVQSTGSKAKVLGGDFIGEYDLATDPDFGCVQWEQREERRA